VSGSVLAFWLVMEPTSIGFIGSRGVLSISRLHLFIANAVRSSVRDRSFTFHFGA
jgi:hypothetical protein